MPRDVGTPSTPIERKHIMAGGFATPTDDVLMQKIRDVERRLNELERPHGTQIAEVVRNLPVPAGDFERSNGFGLASGPVNIGFSVTVPAGKTRVVFTAVGNVAVLDTTSGGLASASAFIEVNGSGFVWSSPVMPAAKDAGAAAVNNIITPVLGFEQGDLTPGGSFLVNMNINATNPLAYPVNASNFGTVAMVATFFN